MDYSKLRRMNKSLKDYAPTERVSQITRETDAILDELGVPNNEALDLIESMQQQYGGY